MKVDRSKSERYWTIMEVNVSLIIIKTVHFQAVYFLPYEASNLNLITTKDLFEFGRVENQNY